MAAKRAFEIAFVGLKQGVHEFNYTVDDKFFVEKGDPDFTNCTANIKLLLDKKSSFMLLKFEIGGKADVICDRCGNSLGMDIWDEFSMLVKLVENPDEMNAQEEDPDVFYISRTESHIDVANWIYEFVLLSFPLQKLCSPDEMGGPQCNKEVLEKLKNMEAKEEQTNANQLWKGLEQFKKTKKERTKK
ncbi:MAG: DUF177 domain-containing protein [Ferruginibacter sp.]|nr:DUF177 domain-containing protein [Bacteroidota bacterium]MBX2919546.1 DUF177 domain-containing protein [Ferruginibacter sp.]MCB0708378.1 DUF177 domain-containing protein [Chitinophagaceae bacterium]MCC7378849.1 DUF177 domain-containing protein [Chitinophagaceae bacterium]